MVRLDRHSKMRGEMLGTFGTRRDNSRPSGYNMLSDPAVLPNATSKRQISRQHNYVVLCMKIRLNHLYRVAKIRPVLSRSKMWEGSSGQAA